MTNATLVRWAVLIAAGLGGAHRAVAQQDVPPSRIAALIVRLGSTDFQEREQAYRDLATVGPQATPKLEAATRHDDPEVSLRARQLVREIQQRAMWEGTPVSVAPGRLHARDVAAAAQRQAGIRLSMRNLIDEAGNPQIVVDDCEPLWWPTIDLLCCQLNGSVRWQYDTCGRTTLVGLTHRDYLAAASSGAFRCEVVRIHEYECREKSGKRIGAAAGPEVALCLSWEPRLQVVEVQRRPHVSFVASDSGGRRHDGVASDEWLHVANGLPSCRVSVGATVDVPAERSLRVRSVQWAVIAVDSRGVRDRRTIRFEFDSVGGHFPDPIKSPQNGQRGAQRPPRGLGR